MVLTPELARVARREVTIFFVRAIFTLLAVVAFLVLANTLGTICTTKLSQVTDFAGTAFFITFVFAVVIPVWYGEFLSIYFGE